MATESMHKNLVKSSHMVFELCEWTIGHTDILITVLRNLSGAK